VFATSALSLPMLLDRRDMDTISAAIVSFNALRGNPAQMLAWAAMKPPAMPRTVFPSPPIVPPSPCALALAAVAAGVLLSFDPAVSGGLGWGALAVAGACLAWAIDNNLTRKVSGGDALTIATIKGIVAGAVNLGVALIATGAQWPGTGLVLAAALTGFLGYGVSLVLFVVSLRALGAARTSAYFSAAPFVGAALALIVLGEVPTGPFWAAAALMAAGVWLHVSEHHEHLHVHVAMEHAHEHVHDEHHDHGHEFPWDGRGSHAHVHRHERLVHRHAHYPDIHHRHSHEWDGGEGDAPDEPRGTSRPAKRG